MRGPWIIVAVCGLALLLTASSSGWLAYGIRVLAVLGLLLAGVILFAGSIRKRS